LFPFRPDDFFPMCPASAVQSLRSLMVFDPLALFLKLVHRSVFFGRGCYFPPFRWPTFLSMIYYYLPCLFYKSPLSTSSFLTMVSWPHISSCPIPPPPKREFCLPSLNHLLRAVPHFSFSLCALLICSRFSSFPYPILCLLALLLLCFPRISPWPSSFIPLFLPFVVRECNFLF